MTIDQMLNNKSIMWAIFDKIENMKVYCTYHNEEGKCSKDDYDAAVSGENPSRMVRVEFATFTQAVPLHTLKILA